MINMSQNTFNFGKLLLLTPTVSEYVLDYVLMALNVGSKQGKYKLNCDIFKAGFATRLEKERGRPCFAVFWEFGQHHGLRLLKLNVHLNVSSSTGKSILSAQCFGGFKVPHHTVSYILDRDWLQTSYDVTKVCWYTRVKPRFKVNTEKPASFSR